MAVRVSQQKDPASMTSNVKLISIMLLCISIFFSVLFFTAWSVSFSDGGLDVAGNDVSLFNYTVSMTALTAALVSMEFFHSSHRALSMLKYGVIIANAVMVGLVIHELTRGYDNLFDISALDTGADATYFTYVALAVGFAGIGTLLSVIHNFHGMMGSA